jgi:hypothetical protein
MDEFRDNYFLRWFPYFTGAEITLQLSIKVPINSTFAPNKLEYSWQLFCADVDQPKYSNIGTMTRNIFDNNILTGLIDLPHLNKETHYDLRVQVSLDNIVLRNWFSIMDFDLLNKDKLQIEIFFGICGFIGGVLATIIVIYLTGQIQ